MMLLPVPPMSSLSASSTTATASEDDGGGSSSTSIYSTAPHAVTDEDESAASESSPSHLMIDNDRESNQLNKNRERLSEQYQEEGKNNSSPPRHPCQSVTNTRIHNRANEELSQQPHQGVMNNSYVSSCSEDSSSSSEGDEKDHHNELNMNRNEMVGDDGTPTTPTTNNTTTTTPVNIPAANGKKTNLSNSSSTDSLLFSPSDLPFIPLVKHSSSLPAISSYGGSGSCSSNSKSNGGNDDGSHDSSGVNPLKDNHEEESEEDMEPTQTKTDFEVMDEEGTGLVIDHGSINVGGQGAGELSLTEREVILSNRVESLESQLVNMNNMLQSVLNILVQRQQQAQHTDSNDDNVENAGEGSIISTNQTSVQQPQDPNTSLETMEIESAIKAAAGESEEPDNTTKASAFHNQLSELSNATCPTSATLEYRSYTPDYEEELRRMRSKSRGVSFDTTDDKLKSTSSTTRQQQTPSGSSNVSLNSTTAAAGSTVGGAYGGGNYSSGSPSASIFPGSVVMNNMGIMMDGIDVVSVLEDDDGESDMGTIVSSVATSAAVRGASTSSFGLPPRPPLSMSGASAGNYRKECIESTGGEFNLVSGVDVDEGGSGKVVKEDGTVHNNVATSASTSSGRASPIPNDCDLLNNAVATAPTTTTNENEKGLLKVSPKKSSVVGNIVTTPLTSEAKIATTVPTALGTTASIMPSNTAVSTANASSISSVAREDNNSFGTGGITSTDKINVTAASVTKDQQQQQKQQQQPQPQTKPVRSFIQSLNLDSKQQDGSASEDVDANMEEFLKVPSKLEGLLFFGLAICFDSFLNVLTVLPLKFVWSCLCFICTLLRPGKGIGKCRFHRRHLYQMIRVFVIVAVYHYCLCPISMGKMYHWIRGQAMLKLYVLMAMVEVFDRLMCSLGQDALDSLYWNTTRRPYHPRMVISTIVVVVYAAIHSVILFVHVGTLNVAMNSSDQTLISLLIGGNFAEIKGTVFKKYNKQNLFQITSSDICERFKLVLFLALVLLLNCAQGGMNQEMVYEYIYMSAIIIFAEMLCDWIKHSFITKFNFIKSSAYAGYALVLAGDLTGVGHVGDNIDHTHAVVKRLGFAQIPLICVMARYFREAARYADFFSGDGEPEHVLYSLAVLYSRGSWSLIGGMMLGAFSILLIIKILLGFFIEKAAHNLVYGPVDKEEIIPADGAKPAHGYKNAGVMLTNRPPQRRQAF